MESSRRSFLAGACAALVAGCTGRPQFSRAPSRPLAGDALLGVQLFTLRQELAVDFDGTLARLRAIGLRSVESAGLFGRSTESFRQSLDRAGLTCTSIHMTSLTAAGTAGKPVDAAALARDLRTLGCSHVVMPTYIMAPGAAPRLPDESGYNYVRRVGLTMTAEDWRRNARFLNETGRSLAAEGLALSYHNHNPEFAPLAGGGTGMDILLAETDPVVVGFELDVGWAAAAGQDVAALVTRHPGRFRQMHAKDVLASTRPNFTYAQDPAAAGEGIVDWPRLLPLAFANGLREIYVEQEPPYRIDAFDAVERGYRYLSAKA
jgi:sugar phosphate isomerase/epimerase